MAHPHADINKNEAQLHIQTCNNLQRKEQIKHGAVQPSPLTGLGCSLVAENALRMHKVLGYVPSRKKKR